MKFKIYGSIFLLTIFTQTYAGNLMNDNAIPKVNRVIPLSSYDTESKGIFYFQNFENLVELKGEFHDSGGLNDSIMRLSENDAFSGKKAIQNSYLPKDSYKENQDPGGSGFVWRFFGDNKLYSRLPIQEPEPQLQMYAGWYHKFEEGFSSQEGRGTLPPKMARMRCFTSPWQSVYSILFWIEGEKGYISIQMHTRAPGVEREWLPNYNTVFNLNTPENLGRWIHFELGVTLGEGHHSDRVQAWADGQLICDMINLDLAGGHRAETLNAMMWDGYWNNGSPRKQSRYFDDLLISKKPVGPARTGLNPVIEIAPQPDGKPVSSYRVEVARTSQVPLSIKSPERKQPKMEYEVVWKGESAKNQVEVNTSIGSFMNKGRQLDYNTLYTVRVQQKDENGNWSQWSNWHSAFATQWAPGTAVENQNTPKGYLLSHEIMP